MSNSFEYSVNPNIKPDAIVQKWGEFKRDTLDLNLLGKYRQEAIRIFDKLVEIIKSLLKLKTERGLF